MIPTIETKVDVYWNLHGKCFSILDRKTRRVVRSDIGPLLIKEVEFVVQLGGYTRTMIERRKNVHAFVRGILGAAESCSIENDFILATYNPYMAPYWKRSDSGNQIVSAEFAILTSELRDNIRKPCVWIKK